MRRSQSYSTESQPLIIAVWNPCQRTRRLTRYEGMFTLDESDIFIDVYLCLVWMAKSSIFSICLRRRFSVRFCKVWANLCVCRNGMEIQPNVSMHILETVIYLSGNKEIKYLIHNELVLVRFIIWQCGIQTAIYCVSPPTKLQNFKVLQHKHKMRE